jgi:hypothetical protein
MLFVGCSSLCCSIQRIRPCASELQAMNNSGTSTFLDEIEKAVTMISTRMKEVSRNEGLKCEPVSLFEEILQLNILSPRRGVNFDYLVDTDDAVTKWSKDVMRLRQERLTPYFKYLLDEANNLNSVRGRLLVLMAFQPFSQLICSLLDDLCTKEEMEHHIKSYEMGIKGVLHACGMHQNPGEGLKKLAAVAKKKHMFEEPTRYCEAFGCDVMDLFTTCGTGKFLLGFLGIVAHFSVGFLFQLSAWNFYVSLLFFQCKLKSSNATSVVVI